MISRNLKRSPQTSVIPICPPKCSKMPTELEFELPFISPSQYKSNYIGWLCQNRNDQLATAQLRQDQLPCFVRTVMY